MPSKEYPVCNHSRYSIYTQNAFEVDLSTASEITCAMQDEILERHRRSAARTHLKHTPQIDPSKFAGQPLCCALSSSRSLLWPSRPQLGPVHTERGNGGLPWISSIGYSACLCIVTNKPVVCVRNDITCQALLRHMHAWKPCRYTHIQSEVVSKLRMQRCSTYMYLYHVLICRLFCCSTSMP